MTIAVGLLSAGGYVLAADTQETAGPFKTDQRKIVTWPPPESCAASHSPHKACAIAGAGHSGYIERVSRDLLAIFSSHDTTSDNWPARVEQCLGTFYTSHVIPFGVRDDLDFSLLIACQFEDAAMMFKTDKTIVIRGDPGLAIGFGEASAKTLMNHIGMVILDARSAALLAAYVVYRVKQSIDFCGLRTQVVVVQGGQAKEIEYPATMKWEAAFANFDMISARFLWDTLSSHLPDLHHNAVRIDPLAEVKDEIRRVVEDTMGGIDNAFFRLSPVARLAPPAELPVPQATRRGRKVRPPSQA